MKFARASEFRRGFVDGFLSPFNFANGSHIREYPVRNVGVGKAWAEVGQVLKQTLQAEGTRIDATKSKDRSGK